jgi:hypothetical protein
VSVSTAVEADEGTSGAFVPEDQLVDEIGGYAEECGKVSVMPMSSSPTMF